LAWRRAGATRGQQRLFTGLVQHQRIRRSRPLLWIRGDEDQVVSDESMFDFGTLGKLGAVPGWPGDEIFPPQPQVAQTRMVFERRQAHGGLAREIVLHEVGHGPLIERSDEVARLMLEHIDASLADDARRRG
jgi:pimeloyl-ACP methyl ester carboxylesterase